tara:strand:- start:3099 stop:3560 length:462 start_codon:yes stop_codon:yes gene_type:complete
MNKLSEIKQSYRIFKLINGDEIICMLSNLDSGYFKVSLPLKMVTVDTMNKDGKYEENLALRRWATFTKEDTFAINKNQVIVHYAVSEGLSKYYEYVIRRYKEFDDASKYTDKDYDYKTKKNNEDKIRSKKDIDLDDLIDQFQNTPYDYEGTEH